MYESFSNFNTRLSETCYLSFRFYYRKKWCRLWWKKCEATTAEFYGPTLCSVAQHKVMDQDYQLL
jgi:hypothetical protein